MATIKLVPSTYYLSNTSYLKMTNPNNMYTDTSSTNYATVANSQTGTTSYYIYLRGFNFSAIQDDWIINSFTIRFKANESGGSTSTSYRPYLCNNTTTITGTVGVINTSVQTLTFTGVTATWETIKGYGANFGIRINCRRNNRNTAANFYIYGAEIEVDYTIPVYHSITTSCTNGTIDPSSVTNVLEGTEQTFKIKGATGRETLSALTFNGANVLPQAVRKEDGGLSYTVEKATGASYEFVQSGNYYVSNNKGVSSSAAVSKVSFNLPVECTVDFYVINYAEATYDYGELSGIDATLTNNASADSTNVFWSGRDNNSANEQKVSYTMPSGEHFVYVKFFKDGYTNSNNDTLQFRVEITPNSPVPGGTFYYEYTMVIMADGVLNAVFGEITQQISIVVNGAVRIASRVWKVIDGKAVEQTDYSTVFETGKNYKM